MTKGNKLRRFFSCHDAGNDGGLKHAALAGLNILPGELAAYLLR